MEEPSIRVGIVSAGTINFTLIGNFNVIGADTPTTNITGHQQARLINGLIEWDGQLFETLEFSPTSSNYCFELSNVAIGIHFHWERRECQRFAGNLQLIVDREHRCLVAVNRIGIEQYLKSVISSEMSANASEALLCAHAVVSRSWLLCQLAERGKHTAAEATEWRTTNINGKDMRELIRWYDREDHKLFDVCADDHCQRYQGITRQTSPAVAAAVEATHGMVLTYNGTICDARFSKCCGGVTETFENCWESTPHPYLTVLSDSADTASEPFCNTRDERILQQVLNSYDRESLDFYRWSVHYTQQQLSELVSRKSGINFGTITALQPLERSASHRITRLLIEGTNESIIVGKELEIRRWLSDSHLRSSAFDVVHHNDGSVTLNGRGWGHGVGMCQIGAAVMGAKGYEYTAILQHYFPNATLEHRY